MNKKFIAMALIGLFIAVTVMRVGAQEKIVFNSITPKSRFEFVRHTYDKTPTAVVGYLFMPPNAVGQVPAVVLSHGSNGIGGSAPTNHPWVLALVSWGYAVFVVDSFAPRGVTSVATNVALLDPMANVADALNALKLLAADPRIDAHRIVHMGFSKGGGAALDTYFDMFRHGVISGDLKFAANIPVYPNGCNMKFRADAGNTNRAPMLVLLAERDDVTIATACIDYINELNADDDLSIKYKVYKGGYHGFDSNIRYLFVVGGEVAEQCDIEIMLTDVPGSGVHAIDKRTHQQINDFAGLNQAWKACKSDKGYTVAGDDKLRAEAMRDVHAFLISVFGS